MSKKYADVQLPYFGTCREPLLMAYYRLVARQEATEKTERFSVWVKSADVDERKVIASLLSSLADRLKEMDKE